jgi:ubiquinone/menaquinone biosynthesis C-methylase UbiE
MTRGAIETQAAVDWKQRAIEQWTADPCGPDVRGQGIRALLRARREYAPWIPEALDYAGACGLDVLDVGCGQGIDLCEYGLAGARITGIDLTPRHVELARAHSAALGLEGTVVIGDAEAMPFADQSFDRASANGVLHHTPDIDAALREMRRVLRPGGLATIIVYNRNSWHFWVYQVLHRGIARGGLLRERTIANLLSSGVECSSIGARPLVRVYTRRQVAELMRSAGFHEVDTTVCPYKPTDTVLPFRPRGGGWYVIGRGIRPGL